VALGFFYIMYNVLPLEIFYSIAAYLDLELQSIKPLDKTVPVSYKNLSSQYLEGT
jgi:hypothetical protein